MLVQVRKALPKICVATALVLLAGAFVALFARLAVDLLGYSDAELLDALYSHLWTGARRHVEAMFSVVGLAPSLARMAGVAGMLLTAPALVRGPGRRVVDALHFRLFSDFDAEVLARIPTPRPLDPFRGSPQVDQAEMLMAWVAPGTGPRAVAWAALQAFVAARSRFARRAWFYRRPDIPFGYTVVVGRSGSGKSRMALEFARMLGAPDTQGRSAVARHVSSGSHWLRIRALGFASRQGDPWDVAWLRPERFDPGIATTDAYDARTPGAGLLASRLGGWRPRLRTVLLLDDPLPGDASAIVKALQGAAGTFAHPVRLLIVNQSMPADLSVGLAQNKLLTPLVEPVVLPAECRLTRDEVRQLVADSPVGPHALVVASALDTFMAVTDGNPFLVELGLLWLHRRMPLDRMTREALLHDRVDRVIANLQAHGFDDGAIQALACATVAKGVPPARKDDLERALNIKNIPASKLQAVLPSEAVWTDSLPDIRPELLGEAFVERILDDSRSIGDDRAAMIVAAAWEANGIGTLRTMLRLGGRKTRTGSLLGTIPVDLDLSNFVLAYGLGEAALTIPRQDWILGDTERGAGLVGAATGYIDKLTPDEAWALSGKFIDLLDPARSNAVVRVPQSFALTARCVIGAGRYAAELSLASVCERLRSWARLLGDWQYFSSWRTAYYLDAGEALDEAVGRLLAESAATSDQDRWRAVTGLLSKSLRAGLDTNLLRCYWGSLSRSFASPGRDGAEWLALQAIHALAISVPLPEKGLGEDPRDQIRDTLRAMVAEPDLDDDAAFLAAETIIESLRIENPYWTSEVDKHVDAVRWLNDLVARRHPGKPDWDWLLIYGRHLVVRGCSEEEQRGLRIASANDKHVASRYAAEPDFVWVRARTWLELSNATFRTEEGSEASRANCLARVASILKAFGEPTRRLAACHWEVLGKQSGYGTLVEEQARLQVMESFALGPSAGHYDFEFERLLCWKKQISEHADEVITAARHVDRIATPGIFSTPDFQYQRAVAWMDAAAITVRVRPAATLMCAEGVDHATRTAFPNDPDFHLWRDHGFNSEPEQFAYCRARAWHSAAFAAIGEPEVCKRCAETVESIISPYFADNSLHQQIHVQAWRALAVAAGENDELHRFAVGKIQDVIDRFDQDDAYRDSAEMEVLRGELSSAREQTR